MFVRELIPLCKCSWISSPVDYEKAGSIALQSISLLRFMKCVKSASYRLCDKLLTHLDVFISGQFFHEYSYFGDIIGNHILTSLKEEAQYPKTGVASARHTARCICPVSLRCGWSHAD